ncbi:aminotransferase class I/II-fold pyridoxal phosphate-dependent enzyme [Streptomyces sp. 8L]|uniref:aminotransferase class I/II-fold pyridoxal phosphate-dependent enzyme n=1 Tax=Streptomyces sp. 8L TaxID=2877242 RepID=UPI001CD48967|nr:aminotransferase class I/II-fold pyridoxal phosphate-dependent enzyme [Streptomyces sp. 8L]MCA1219012.1 aminotransferase class I/II-fold pyridoxal phosphate-dependent enzyme [Streptomyces sp. 8L]
MPPEYLEGRREAPEDPETPAAVPPALARTGGRVGAAELAARFPEVSARGITAAMTEMIRSGDLAPGVALPTVRALAAALTVSPGTVAQAWSRLRTHRMITTSGRRGSVVSGPPTVPHPTRFELFGHFGDRLGRNLAMAAPDPALLPPLGAALAAATDDAGLNDYARVAVTPRLAAAVQDTWPFEAEAWTAVGGGYEGVELLCRALLVPGDRVAVEEPTAARLLDILEAHDVQKVPVACDDDGPLPDSLAAALRTRPTLFLYQPRAQSPCGWTITEERADLLAGVLAAAPAVLLVEDDGSGPLALRPAASLAARLPERSVLVRSYSKSHGPDLRVAVLGGRRDVVDKVRVLRTYGTGWTSRILQNALAYLLTDAATAERVENAALRYGHRRRAMAERLAERGVPTHNRDGLSLWVPVADESAALVTLAARGITVSPGTRFVFTPSHGAHVRVATSKLTEDPAALDEIADLLAHAAGAADGMH